MSTLTPDERATRAGSAQRTLVTVAAGALAGRVRVGLRADGASDRPVVRPMLLTTDTQGARVALVPEGALLLAGDAIAIDVEVGDGLTLDLVEPAGTVAYDMRGDQATWDVRVVLGAGARLTWHGEPFVVAAGARVRRTTAVTVGAGAALALRETLVLGRHDEPSGVLVQELEATDADGNPLLVEELLVSPATLPVILGGHRVVDSVVVLGAEVGAVDGCCRLDLECGGTVLRQLADVAHRGLTDTHWRAAVDAVAR